MKLSKEDLYKLEQLNYWFDRQRCMHTHFLSIITTVLNHELDK